MSHRFAISFILLILFTAYSYQQCNDFDWGIFGDSFVSSDAIQGSISYPPSSTDLISQNFDGGPSLSLQCSTARRNLECAGWRSPSSIVQFGDVSITFAIPSRSETDPHLRPTLVVGTRNPSRVTSDTVSAFEMSIADRNDTDDSSLLSLQLFGPVVESIQSNAALAPGDYTLTIHWRETQLAVRVNSDVSCDILMDLSTSAGLEWPSLGAKLYIYSYYPDMPADQLPYRDPDFVYTLSEVSYTCDDSELICIDSSDPSTTTSEPTTTSSVTTTPPTSSITTTQISTTITTLPTTPPQTTSSATTTPATTITPPPVTTDDCGSDVPQSPQARAYCLNSIWHIDPQSTNTEVTFSAPVLLTSIATGIAVRSHVRFDSATILRFAEGRTFSVLGHLVLNGTLVLDLSRHNASFSNGKRQSNVTDVPRDVSFSFASSTGNFSVINVSSDSRLCPVYRAVPSRTATSLRFTFEIISKQCNSSKGGATKAWVYILVVVLVIVVVLALLVAAFVLWRRSLASSAPANGAEDTHGKPFFLKTKPDRNSADATSDLSYSLLADPDA